MLVVDIIDTNINTVDANALLGRGAALWVTNVITFSFWFWILDRGGPAERAARSDVAPSFAFPEDATPELAPENWMPRYHDYLVPVVHERDGVQPDRHASCPTVAKRRRWPSRSCRS